MIGFVGGVVGLFEQSTVDINDEILEAYRNQVMMRRLLHLKLSSVSAFTRTLPAFLSRSKPYVLLTVSDLVKSSPCSVLAACVCFPA